YCYTPNYCVNVGDLLGSLFVNPGCCHYCFGDYFTRGCFDRGYRPWWLHGARHFDPLFAHAHWQHRFDHGWYRGLRDTYLGRLHGDLPRPPRTLAEQRAFRDASTLGARDLHAVRPLDRFHNARLTLARADHGQLQEQRRAAEHFRAVSHERQV